MEKKIPMRSCVACKTVKPKKELIRIVKNEEGISLDFSGKKNGRGAYICDCCECLAKLKKNKVLNRVFSCEVSQEVYENIERDYIEGKNKG